MGARLRSFLFVALRSIWSSIFPQSLLSTYPLLHEETEEPTHASCSSQLTSPAGTWFPCSACIHALGWDLGRFPPCCGFPHMRGCACTGKGGTWVQQVHHSGCLWNPSAMGVPVVSGDHPGASPKCFLTLPRYPRGTSMLTAGHQPGATATLKSCILSQK